MKEHGYAACLEYENNFIYDKNPNFFVGGVLARQINNRIKYRTVLFNHYLTNETVPEVIDYDILQIKSYYERNRIPFEFICNSFVALEYMWNFEKRVLDAMRSLNMSSDVARLVCSYL